MLKKAAFQEIGKHLRKILWQNLASQRLYLERFSFCCFSLKSSEFLTFQKYINVCFPTLDITEFSTRSNFV